MFSSPAKQEVLFMAKRKNQKLSAAKKAQKSKSQLTANRKYKDTVFRMLFTDRENLLSLYNAICGTSYDKSEELEIVTLENAIYMGMKNDLAFIIDTNLFLYEHQSTYNANMPLRDLFYISGEYQKLVDHRSLYSSTLQKIPAPNFIVFYNGTEKKEERWVSYLSEAYENLSGEPNLELKVITFNINEGYNKELMKQCRILREYSLYVSMVREYARDMELNAAVELAVNECIQRGILAEFLQKSKSEVIAVSIFEYDKEEEERKLRKAEFEAGIVKGKLQKARETASSLQSMGLPVEKIAQAVNVDEKLVQEWLK